MASFGAPMEDDRQNEFQPWPTPDGEPVQILDDGPAIEGLIEGARSLYLETVESVSRFAN